MKRILCQLSHSVLHKYVGQHARLWCQQNDGAVPFILNCWQQQRIHSNGFTRQIISLDHSELLNSTQATEDGVEPVTSKVTRPAAVWHTVHMHSPLPLERVSLGSDGEYVIASRRGGPVFNRSADLDTDDYDYYPTRIQWSSNLPHAIQTALKAAEFKGDLGMVALSKAKDQHDNWLVKAVDCNNEWYWETYLGSNISQDILSKKFTVLGQPITEDDIECIDQIYFAPDNGWFMHLMDRYDTGDDHAAWQGLPESLDGTLTKYVEAYGGVEWLSVGHGGEWFVKFQDGFSLWEGLHPVLDLLLKKQRVSDYNQTKQKYYNNVGRPVWVELGPDKTFVGQFEHGTVWYAQDELTAALINTLQPSRT